MLRPPDPARVGQLLADLTLEEKVSLTAGVDMWHTATVGRLGIRAMKMTDGPVGARGAEQIGGPPSACFPCGTALAATWDIELIERVGQELGGETRAKGAHVLLAPTVNMHRSPLAGRNFECFSEDPHLTARAAVAYIDGVQSQGVGACIKHFVANDSEFERFTMSSEVPERALREVYLRPFEIALDEAGPVAVMAAYNRLHGIWCSENRRLLTTILRDEWGWDGLVVSDWWATHSTEAAATAGLDIEMPGPTLHRGAQLVEAVDQGDVDESGVDALARRVLAAMVRTGAADAGPGAERSEDTPARRQVAREAAAASVVLLKNATVSGSPVLPLDRVRSLAVIGVPAVRPAPMGGGSAQVTPPYVVAPLDALREQLGPGVEVTYEPGCSPYRFPPRIGPAAFVAPGGERGLLVELIAGPDASAGNPVETSVAARGVFSWPDPPRTDMSGAWSARIRGDLTVGESGKHVFQVGGTGRFRLFVGGDLVVDGSDLSGPGRREGAIDLAAGTAAPVRVEFNPLLPVDRQARLELRLLTPLPADALDRAAAAAGAADAAVVFVGTDADTETEGRDRRSMALPGDQGELVVRVVEANPRTAVVVNSGAPVAMPWADGVPAIAQLWFAGQEIGNAAADVLTGSVNPAGRLPTTFPRRIQDTPAYTNYPGEFEKVEYGEGVFVGYRWYDARAIDPLFPFGHGLSYTSFEYGPSSVAGAADGPGTVTVTVPVTNTGARAGAEVVQLYVAPVQPSVARPPQELKAFAKVGLEPGETSEVALALDAQAFAFWDPSVSGWRTEPGDYELRIGASSRDIRSRTTITRA